MIQVYILNRIYSKILGLLVQDFCLNFFIQNHDAAIHLSYSVFILAAGHSTVQYIMARYTYFFKCKQVSYRAEAYRTVSAWPC